MINKLYNYHEHNVRYHLNQLDDGTQVEIYDTNGFLDLTLTVGADDDYYHSALYNSGLEVCPVCYITTKMVLNALTGKKYPVVVIQHR